MVSGVGYEVVFHGSTLLAALPKERRRSLNSCNGLARPASFTGGSGVVSPPRHGGRLHQTRPSLTAANGSISVFADVRANYITKKRLCQAAGCGKGLPYRCPSRKSSARIFQQQLPQPLSALLIRLLIQQVARRLPPLPFRPISGRALHQCPVQPPVKMEGMQIREVKATCQIRQCL